jgi:hypothetical protein
MWRESIKLYQACLQGNPNDKAAWLNLGVIYRQSKQWEAAIACYRRVLAVDSKDSGAWSNLGNVFKDAHCFDAACEAHETALQIQPASVESRFNYAITLREAGRFQQALDQLGRCDQAQPGDAKIEWEKAICLLYLGRFKEGWSAYEARWHTGELPARQERIPYWKGEPLRGKKILLHAEQGYGDTILTARFIPWVKEQGAIIGLECKPELHRLFSALPVDEFLEPGKGTEPLASHDFHCGLMSLPGLYGAGEDNIPASVKLAIPEQSRKKFSFISKKFANKLKVGVVWSGSVTFKDNRNRCAPLRHFLRFAQNTDVRVFSLQKGPRQRELGGLEPLVVDLGDQLDDFADTAAAVQALDLIVMTDSSVAHLAASLGKPVINLLNWKPYWLYGMEGDATPWYPAMHLVRQTSPGDWDTVFARAGQLVQCFVSEKKLTRDKRETIMEPI